MTVQLSCFPKSKIYCIKKKTNIKAPVTTACYRENSSKNLASLKKTRVLNYVLIALCSITTNTQVLMFYFYHVENWSLAHTLLP